MNLTNYQFIDYLSLIIFIIAICHTFLTRKIKNMANKYIQSESIKKIVHIFNDVEIVFACWAFIFTVICIFQIGISDYFVILNKTSFTEPFFVMSIMILCSSLPILKIAVHLIEFFYKLPYNKSLIFYFITLTIGPILGSFITEPAAMTVTSLLLSDYLFKNKLSERLKYATLGLLFVNISIGGTLLPFSAPPVIMVAEKWGWDSYFMLTNFGWKAIIAIFISTFLITYYFRNEIKKIQIKKDQKLITPPHWVTLVHLHFLVLMIFFHKTPALIFIIFMIFLGVYKITKKYQTRLQFAEGIKIGLFLVGIVLLGQFQAWWISPLLLKLNNFEVFSASILLTSFLDNVLITYLGTLVFDISETTKLLLVSGAVCGGGLTVIANAPNPIGFNILNGYFEKGGIGSAKLFLYALIPTLICSVIFYIL